MRLLKKKTDIHFMEVRRWAYIGSLVLMLLSVVVLATRDENDPDSMTRYEKSVSNIQEVKARDGIVISVVTEGDHLARRIAYTDAESKVRCLRADIHRLRRGGILQRQ